MATIGHLDLTAKFLLRKKPTISVGTKYEIELNSRATKKTNYVHAAISKDTSQCLIVDGWLLASIKQHIASPGEAASGEV